MSGINSHQQLVINKLRSVGLLTLMGLATISDAAYVSVNVATALGDRIQFDEILADEMLSEADLRLNDSSSIGSVAAWAGGSATGALRARTTASMVPPGSFNHSAGIANAMLFDLLTFVIPAGTYDTDLNVTLTGNISGTLSASGDTVFTFSQVDFNASLTALDGFSFSARTEESPGTQFDQDFKITTTLVPAGTTVFSTQEQTLGLAAQLRTEARAAETAPASGSASAEFYNTVRFLSLDVPSGITWTSESGQFLVPVPAAAWLFGSGLIGIIGLARRKKS